MQETGRGRRALVLVATSLAAFTATLDNTDRSQLGLDINHMVQGVVPIEVTVGRDASDQSLVRLHADLTNADLLLEGVGWRKPPGRAATLQCDIAKGKTYKSKLEMLDGGKKLGMSGCIAFICPPASSTTTVSGCRPSSRPLASDAVAMVLAWARVRPLVG